jgi:hypothetical protein
MPIQDPEILELRNLSRQLTELRAEHEQLLQVIRNAERLIEVTRYAGPSSEQRAASRRSHDEIERIELCPLAG